ncbi:hypothetical protein HOLleu_17130 [Holothuria leucospilota]|uniref:Gamma-glutamylcyclotransferase n=1 Tax=Holothuria leucospilota TaxID=206669 RepID=A0A9Q1C6P6_HOLLE|nr:hypothetical protein HOLleu_17130 [Holothuria leucospilota]
MEPVGIAPVKQQGSGNISAVTSVTWREPIARFPDQSHENFNHTSEPVASTAYGQLDGVPSSVVIVSQQSAEDARYPSESENRATIQSRARARRNDEPAPFLCVDNLPIDKVVVDGKDQSASPAVRKIPAPTTVHRQNEVEQAKLSTVRKSSAGCQSPASRGTPRSTPRNTPSATFYNYNSFFTHKNPAFLAGPPNLWSLNNRFWPHATPPLNKSNLPPLPSALSLEAATLRQNSQVTQPFKHHGSQPSSNKVNERSTSPSFELKSQTVKAIHDVSRQLSKHSATSSSKAGGRLLKGRLQPLHTFKMDGPSIEKCQGIQPEGTNRSYTPSQSRLLQRKRELLNLLPPDIFQTRPQTQESIHRTSVASNWDETRYNDFESDLAKTEIDSQHPGQPSRLSKQESQHPNSPINLPVELDTGEADPGSPKKCSDKEGHEENVDLPQEEIIAPQNNQFSSQSMSELIFTDGGASQILCNMITRVKTNSVASDPGVRNQDSPDQISDQENPVKEDITKIRERLKRAKSEPVLSVGRMTLASHLLKETVFQSSIGEQVEGDVQETILYPVSGTFSVRSEEENNLSQTAVQENEEEIRNPQVSNLVEVKGSEHYLDEEEGKENPPISVRSPNVGDKDDKNSDTKGLQFFISETSDVDKDSVIGLNARETSLASDLDGPPEAEDDLIRDISEEQDNMTQEDEKGRTQEEQSAKKEEDRIKEHCKDVVKSEKHDDNDDSGGGTGGGGGYSASRGVSEGTQNNQNNNQDNTDGENERRSVQDKTDENGDDLDDIPDIEEAVLFCGFCGQDIDECQCNYNLEGNKEHDMSIKELALVSNYERILSANSKAMFVDYDMEDLEQSKDAKRSSVRRRPDSAPSGLTMMVMQGKGILKDGTTVEKVERQPHERDVSLEVSGDNAVASGENQDLSVVASLKPRHSRSATQQQSISIPPLCFTINTRPAEGKAYYFAYGAEMNASRMQSYMGSPQDDHRLWGVLYGFELQFNRRGEELSAGGFPNIVYNANSSVEGCIYHLTLDQLSLLDGIVGFPKFCIKVVLPVWMLNCKEPTELGVAQYCVPAVMYIARDEWTHNEAICNSYNLKQCLMGGDLLTPSYLHHLQSLQCHCCS